MQDCEAARRYHVEMTADIERIKADVLPLRNTCLGQATQGAETAEEKQEYVEQLQEYGAMLEHGFHSLLQMVRTLANHQQGLVESRQNKFAEYQSLKSKYAEIVKRTQVEITEEDHQCQKNRETVNAMLTSLLLKMVTMAIQVACSSLAI